VLALAAAVRLSSVDGHDYAQSKQVGTEGVSLVPLGDRCHPMMMPTSDIVVFLHHIIDGASSGCTYGP
jgi:hypothetical protein